ncbi:CinA family protein [Desulfitibacter alkalitolerans]|uniref:CinA family protein n=1 Tax=Desulfitibacter alkalitolerans TaxID=264641 RepID=UPI0004811F3D|nr:CinA family protein [Desulfitibacter alkalitolerans]
MNTLQCLINLLKEKGLKIAVAESCTGGLLGGALTSMPGSSEFFEMGIIAYSNKSKIKLLGIRDATIHEYGAVSENTAKEMAINIKNTAGTHIGVSITGIAGPGGGSRDKPVGLVYIGISMEDNTYIYKHCFGGDRASIRKQSVLSALEHILSLLVEER